MSRFTSLKIRISTVVLFLYLSLSAFSIIMPKNEVSNIYLGLNPVLRTQTDYSRERISGIRVGYFHTFHSIFFYETSLAYVRDMNKRSQQVNIDFDQYTFNCSLGLWYTYLFRYRIAIGYGLSLENYRYSIFEYQEIYRDILLHVGSFIALDYSVDEHWEVNLYLGNQYRLKWQLLDWYYGFNVAYRV